MPTLTIHLGLHKTGTTALQVALAAQRELLAEHGVFYPKRKANHSEDLYTMFSSKAEVHLPNVVENRVGEAFEEYRNNCFDAWRQILTDTPTDAHILVSGEDLSLLDEEGWMALLDFFGPFVSEVQAVAVVREPVAWARSKLQQSLKGGKPLVAGVVPTLFQNLEKRLGPALASLGRDRLDVYDYDELMSAPGGLVPALAERCGVPPEISLKLPVENKNVRLSAEASLLLGSLNRSVDYREEASKGDRRFPGDFRAFHELPGSSFRLTEAQQDAVTERWSRDATYLQEHFGLDIEAKVDPKVSEDQFSEISDPEVLSEIAQRLVRGLIEAKRNRALALEVNHLNKRRDELRQRIWRMKNRVIPVYRAIVVSLAIALIWALAT